MNKTFSALAAIALLFVGSPASAVGDEPVRLTQRQAAAFYQSVRFLLASDVQVCPAGQVPVSGLITGGSSPVGGSRTTTILFNAGARLKVVRMWDGPPTNRRVTVQVSCP